VKYEEPLRLVLKTHKSWLRKKYQDAVISFYETYPFAYQSILPN